jgi:parallel beta-helix repeat protein
MIRDVSRVIALLLAAFVVVATVPSVALGAGGAGGADGPADTVAPGTGSASAQVGTAPSTTQARPGLRTNQQGAAPQEVTECTTIDSPGSYVLAGNITRDAPPEEQTTCIEISADDVVLDGNGYEIEGNTSYISYPEYTVIGGAAIRAANVSNLTIRDVRVRSWKYGIRLESVTEADVQFRGYDYAGLSAVGSEHIRLHDSVLRSANAHLDAEHVVVRRNDINTESLIFDGNGIGVEGSDAIVENNFVNAPPADQRLRLKGIRLDGNRSLIRDNLVIGTPPPTRRDPLELDGGGFRVTGDDNRIYNMTVERTRQGSSIDGDNNTLTNSRVNVSNAVSPMSVEGNDNIVSDSVLAIDGFVSISGSGGGLENVSANQTRVSVGMTGGTIVDSRFLSLSIGAGIAVGDVTARQINIDGANASLRNSSAERVTVGGSNATVAHVRIESEVSDLPEYGYPTRTLGIGSTGSTIRNVSVSNIEMDDSDENRLENITAGNITLDGSEENTLSGVTATETVTLRSISDNNTITRSTAGLIDVTDNSRNNTVRANDAAIRVAGQHSYDNRLLDNDASDGNVGIELDRASRTLVRNNTITNNSQGILLEGASDNRLLNNTATDNDGAAYRSRNGSVNNTVEGLTIGPTVSFRSRDVALATEPSPPALPAGRTDLGVFLEASPTSPDAWLNLTTSYPDPAADIDEASIRLWRYNDSWDEVSGVNRVNPATNTVRANVTAGEFGVLAPLANGTSDDTTAPTVTAFDARADGDALVVTFDASEPLAAIDVSVENASGATVAQLTASEFTETGTGPSIYTGQVALPNGTYTVTLERASDAAGNDGAAGQSAIATLGGGSGPGEESRLAVVPANETIEPGESVRVPIVYNASAGTEVYGVQFGLDYNTTLLNVTSVTRGSYLGAANETLVVTQSIDRKAGRVSYGESRRTAGGVTGDGTVAVVEVQVADGFAAGVLTRADLSLVEVKVSDPDGQGVATTPTNASVLVGANAPPTLTAELSFGVNNVGSPLDVAVEASDRSGVSSVRLIDPSGSTVDTLACDATECNGTLSTVPETSSWNGSVGAYDDVSYRVVATDSEGANATATVASEVYIAGDGTGDGVVDIVDAVAVGQSWNCAVGESCYAAAGDLNNDGVVDIFDTVLIGRNWQETAGTG